MGCEKKKDYHFLFKFTIVTIALIIIILIFLFIPHINNSNTELNRIYGDVYGNLSAEGAITGVHDEKEIGLGISAKLYQNISTSFQFNITNCSMIRILDMSPDEPSVNTYDLKNNFFLISISNGTIVAGLTDVNIEYDYNDLKGIDNIPTVDYYILHDIGRVCGTAKINHIDPDEASIYLHRSIVTINNEQMYFEIADIYFDVNDTPTVHLSGKGVAGFSKMPKIFINGSVNIDDFQVVSRLGIKRERFPKYQIQSKNIVITTIRPPEIYEDPRYPWRIRISYPD